ncbi:MAG: hypothetical protein K0S07_995 [Chlamydiales bacterium]|jgi:hypothetical protein|nr:hypothetical protein [Chlamydiales bacterium]
MSHHSNLASTTRKGVFKLGAGLLSVNHSLWLSDGPEPSFLRKQAITNSTSVSFNNLVHNYNTYAFYIFDLSPQNTGARLQVEYSIDNGLTYLSTGYQYKYLALNTSGSGSSLITPSSKTFSSTSNAASFAIMHLYNPQDATQYKQMELTMSHIVATATAPLEKMAGVNTSSIDAVNGIRFSFDNGPIANGMFYLYGMF